MTGLLFLCVPLLLLLGPTWAGTRQRRNSPVNISSPDWTETEFLDFDNPTDVSNNDSATFNFWGTQLSGTHSNNTSATGSECPHDLCKLWDMCDSNHTCITSPAPECKSKCMKDGSEETDYTSTVAGPEGNTTLRPKENRTCPDFPGLECIHGIPRNCNETVQDNRRAFSCKCDSGWTGFVCNKACTLPCVHGDCVVTVDDGMICSCEYEYVGKLCADRVPDPKVRSLILAAALSSALAIAVILIISIPIIMWRLRIILVLRLIYIFREYEDEDGKENDAYISMTSTPNADKFVYGYLQPILEKHNFKLFLLERDAVPGEVQSEIILSAMEKSRRTIMIITPDYIRNEWNRFEYLIAQHETLKLQQRIIPIILEDVEKENFNMDKSLKHILDSIKCLKYPKAKPKSVASGTDDSPQDIQSPDSNKSVNSTTYFYRKERSYSTVSVSKEETAFERKAEKFWKRLVLTMPKKKTQKDKSGLSFPSLPRRAKYNISTNNIQETSRNLECNKQTVSEFDFKINFIDKKNEPVFTKPGNTCKAKNISEETKIQNNLLISSIA